MAVYHHKKSLTHWPLVVGLILLEILTRISVSFGQEDPAYLREVRTIKTLDFGVANPVGLAFSPKANALLVLDSPGGARPGLGNSNVVLITLSEDSAGSVSLVTSIPDPLNMAFNGQANSLFILDKATNELIEIKAGPAGNLDPADQASTRFDVRQFGLKNPRGIAFDSRSGRLYVLDAATSRIVRITPDSQQGFDGAKAVKEGRISQIPLSSGRPFQPQGIAFNPSNGHLYLLSPAGKKLYEITETGQAISSRDVSSLNLIDPQGMLFAPSGDNTDDPSIMDLYISDGGRGAGSSRGQSPGRIMELSLTEPSLSAVSEGTVYASLVRTIDTSLFSPPSPDPSGMSYRAASNTLLISDAEVDEMPPYFTGKNVFEATTAGSLVKTFRTTAFSHEPTGVAVNPSNGHIFYSDDVQKKVFEVGQGSDGIYGTSDDVVTSLSTSAFNDSDPEGVAYGQGKLFVTNGLGKEAYIVNPGANGIFDGVPPAGDDTVTHFDTSSMGQMNPEGIDFNPDTGTLYIISNEERSDIVETTTTGTVVRVIAIPSVSALHPAAVAYAPGSMNPTVKHLYIADRGVDNGDDPNENDGKVYEITLDDSPPPDNLLANPGFESDPDNDGKPNRWVPYDSTFTRRNTVVHGGSYAGKQFATDNGDYNIGQIVNYLTAGTTYNFSGWVNIPATSDSFTFKLQVRWRDVNNNNIRTDTVKTYSGPTGGWNLATASLVAPAGTTNGRVQMVATSLNATIYVDDFVFKP